MKSINKTFVILLLLFHASNVFAKNILEWKYDGSISNGSIEVKTKLDNTYYAYTVLDGIYLAGFVIDKNGENHPYIVYVNNELSNMIHWAQNNSVEQVFSLNDEVFLLDEEGNIKVNKNSEWVKSALHLLPKSVIVHNDGYLIACIPAPIAKSNVDNGGCYSPEKGWFVKLSWREIKPQVCGSYLIAIEDFSMDIQGYKINVDTGKVESKIKLNTLPISNLCNVFKNSSQ